MRLMPQNHMPATVRIVWCVHFTKIIKKGLKKSNKTVAKNIRQVIKELSVNLENTEKPKEIGTLNSLQQTFSILLFIYPSSLFTV